MPQVTSDQLTLIAAVIAAVGATGAAFIALFSASRSKYIDTVTLTRIAWVRELRSDFSKLLSAFTKLSTSEAHNLSEDAKYSLQIETTELMMLLALKLNRRSPLDREISQLMHQAMGHALQESDELTSSGARLAIVVEELLKEEWETAKFESSGPVRRIKIWWTRLGREDARKQRRRRWLEEPKQAETDKETHKANTNA